MISFPFLVLVFYNIKRVLLYVFFSRFHCYFLFDSKIYSSSSDFFPLFIFRDVILLVQIPLKHCYADVMNDFFVSRIYKSHLFVVMLCYDYHKTFSHICIEGLKMFYSRCIQILSFLRIKVVVVVKIIKVGRKVFLFQKRWKLSKNL